MTESRRGDRERTEREGEPDMNVLVIGGTGVLSTDVCRLAAEKGFSVYALNRGRRKHLLDPAARLITADVKNEPARVVREKLGGLFFDTVIDFIAFTAEDVRKHLEIVSGKCGQFILVSSAAVYIRGENGRITDESPVGNRQWGYARNKCLCEEKLKEIFAEHCENWTIVRPYVTWNDTRIPYPMNSDDNWTLVNRILHGKPVVVWDDGEAKCTITHSKDFAAGTVGLFGNERAYGQSFNTTSDCVRSWKEVLEAVIEAAGNTADIERIPLSRIIATLPEYRWFTEANKGVDVIVDSGKLRTVVPESGTEVLFEQGIRSTVEFFRSHRELQKTDYRWEGRMDYLLRKYCRENGRRETIRKLNIRGYDAGLRERITYHLYRNIAAYTLVRVFRKCRRLAGKLRR